MFVCFLTPPSQLAADFQNQNHKNITCADRSAMLITKRCMFLHFFFSLPLPLPAVPLLFFSSSPLLPPLSLPGNANNMALYYFEPEITPTINQAVVAYLAPTDTPPALTAVRVNAVESWQAQLRIQRHFFACVWVVFFFCFLCVVLLFFFCLFVLSFGSSLGAPPHPPTHLDLKYVFTCC